MMKTTAMTDHNERYLTIKELQYELRLLGLPCSRGVVDSAKKRGAPFVCNRISLGDFLEWLKARPRGNAKRCETVRKRVK